ncbi:M36 family metallopeptidase [Candidatus Riflebacteria bacterium]
MKFRKIYYSLLFFLFFQSMTIFAADPKKQASFSFKENHISFSRILKDNNLKTLSNLYPEFGLKVNLQSDGALSFFKLDPAPTKILKKDTLHTNPQFSWLQAENLKKVRTLKSRKNSTHEYFLQIVQNKPLFHCYVNMHSKSDGEITGIQAKTIDIPDDAEKLKFKLNKKEALAFAKKNGKLPNGKVLFFKKIFYPLPTGLVPAYRIIIFDMKIPAEWELIIGNHGEILEKSNLLKFLKVSPRPLPLIIEGKGKVFNPNPVVSLRNYELKDQDDTNYQALVKAYKNVTLENLDGSGFLKGLYVDLTLRKNSAYSDSGNFIYTRNQPEFEDVMVYYHIDRAQRYIQSLGFININNRSQRVNSRATLEDNSWYSPTAKNLCFGCGGVDDAEDADIILHEYGHAIQDSIIPGFGRSHEAASIGEGFSDFFAACLNDREEHGLPAENIGDWDAVSFSEKRPPYLRKITNNKKYPEDMAYEVHADGEIWSDCLWKLRKELPKKTAEIIILEAHFYMTPYTSFVEAAEAILLADTQVNKAKNHTLIRKVFKNKGILIKNTENALEEVQKFWSLHNK